MKKRSSSIAVSKLARYASDPNSVFDKVDAGAVKYGNRAHNAIGAGPVSYTHLTLPTIYSV